MYKKAKADNHKYKPIYKKYKSAKISGLAVMYIEQWGELYLFTVCVSVISNLTKRVCVYKILTVCKCL